jgi:hypothetical protein
MIVLPEIIFDFRFAVGRARGVLAKNDRLDARLIAEYVAIMPTRVVQRDPDAEQLARSSPCGDSFATSMFLVTTSCGFALRVAC